MGPASMIALGGGSFGFQIGGQSIDVVMLFMTPDSIKYLLRDKVTLGGDAAAAAGPIGRAASAETSGSLKAEILTYSRSRGLFAGLSLSGAVIARTQTPTRACIGARSVRRSCRRRKRKHPRSSQQVHPGAY